MRVVADEARHGRRPGLQSRRRSGEGHRKPTIGRPISAQTRSRSARVDEQEAERATRRRPRWPVKCEGYFSTIPDQHAPISIPGQAAEPAADADGEDAPIYSARSMARPLNDDEDNKRQATTRPLSEWSRWLIGEARNAMRLIWRGAARHELHGELVLRHRHDGAPDERAGH